MANSLEWVSASHSINSSIAGHPETLSSARRSLLFAGNPSDVDISLKDCFYNSITWFTTTVGRVVCMM